MDDYIMVDGKPVKEYIDGMLNKEIDSTLKNQISTLSKSAYKPIITKKRIKYQSFNKGGDVKKYTDEEIREMYGFMARPNKHKKLSKNVIEVLKHVDSVTIKDISKILHANPGSVSNSLYRLHTRLGDIILKNDHLFSLKDKSLSCEEVYKMYTNVRPSIFRDSGANVEVIKSKSIISETNNDLTSIIIKYLTSLELKIQDKIQIECSI